MKKICYLLAFSALCFSSCKKSINNFTPNLNDSVAVSEDSKTKNGKPAISVAEVNAWFSKNPAGKFLIPDWGKAQQRIVGNMAVVKVPIRELYNENVVQSTGTKQLNGLKNSSGVNPAHPPMLFLFKDRSAAGDSLRPILMNFVPDNINTEVGENNVWTGKLVEWDLQSDTGFYQVMKKSYVASKNKFNVYGGSNSLNSVSGSKIKVIPGLVPFGKP